MHLNLSDSPNKKQRFYRSDIDGLRAIAVIIVMFYHYAIGPFSGGFVGVDIFFVISGYLITGGIVNQKEANKFRFSDFYVRRARRLFPALLCVVLLSYFSAFLLFSPVDFAKMSGSTIFALSGISNIFFWMEADYFDSASIVKPLLHTWSLSVELQFYLVWPAVLVFLVRFGKKAALYGVVSFTLIGIIASIIAIKHDATGAFYLTQFRFHEFALGGIVYFASSYGFLKNNKKISSLFFVIGMLLVLFSALKYTIHTTFPGLNALVPTIGAALIILCGDKTIFSKILSFSPVRYTGEISYSLYLVHWPLYVFVQYYFIHELSGVVRACLVVATFVIASLMHKYIEKPFRDTKRFAISSLAFCSSCGIIAVLIMLPATGSWMNRGWVWRLPEQIRNINNFVLKDYQNYVWARQVAITSENNYKFNGKKKLLIIGDSQSADIVNMMSESGYINNYDVVARTVSYECGTPYVKDNERYKYLSSENPVTAKAVQLIPVCEKQMADASNEELLKNADVIFIAMKWEFHSTPRLQAGIDFYRSRTNAEIVVFGNKTLSKSSIDIVNSMGRTTSLDEYASQLRSQPSEQVNNTIASMNGFTFVNMMNLTCPRENSCNVLTKDLKPIFFDPAHLTRYGAVYLGSKFTNLLEKNNV